MSSFFNNIQNAEEELSRFLATLGMEVSPREAAFALTIALMLVCGLATIITAGTVTGENTVLGKEYGNYDVKKARIKSFFFGVAVVFGVLAALVMILDGFANFFNTAMFFSYFGTILQCLIIEGAAFFIGSMIGGAKEEERDKKNKHQIHAILSENPVFVDTLARIKNDPRIKMVVFFRDGIAFSNQVTLPTDNKKEEISYYDKNFSKNGPEKALATIGSVTCAAANSRILFSDYGYQNSESAMQDLYKYIDKTTVPRFKNLEYTKRWTYRESSTTTGPTGAVIHGNQVTFTGYSSKPGKSETSGNVLISCILYDDSLDEKPTLKAW